MCAKNTNSNIAYRNISVEGGLVMYSVDKKGPENMFSP